MNQLLDLQTVLPVVEDFLPQIGLIVSVAIILFFVNFTINSFRNKVLREMKRKKQRYGFMMFMRVLKYTIFIVVICLALWLNYGSFKNFGFALGIVSVALGFALQKPITGIVVWIGIVVKRPFEVGDRISVGEVRGNVVDITTGHIFLEEVGRYGGEEPSGRVILIPNASLLDKDVINYSYQNDYILGQVVLSVTYESDFDEAVRLVLQAATMHTKDFNKAVKRDAHYRMAFQDSGIEVLVRYYVPVSLAQKVSTEISYDIHKLIKASSKVEMAYPHIKVLKN